MGFLRAFALISLILITNTVALALPAKDIVFVTQIPIPQDFTTVNSTFGNQLGSVTARGFGDLYIRYADGTLRNLTAAAGFGNDGFQGATSIAVRDPAVHWSGNKIIFSMVVGAPTARYQVKSFYWQLYEIVQFGKNETPVITKVANQPDNYNNIMPIYGSNEGEIFFVTDRPRNGAAHLYPQRDEYESAPTNTGLWKLVPETGALTLIDHAPSGDFHPIIDSFGRVIFTRWDHLQRDQQSDNESGVDKGYGAFNFSDESANATRLNSIEEYFPEHEDSEAALEFHPNVYEHRFNHFFPWMVNQDGTELETLNHVGRHELHGYIPKTFKDDPSLEEFYGQISRVNPRSINSMFHIKEDPNNAGRYYGIDCPEFGTHTAGQIINFDAPPSKLASEIVVNYITHRATSSTSNSPNANHVGLFRNPLPLTDGVLIASHTSETSPDSNIGTSTAPLSKYAFRIKTVVPSGSGFYVPGELLTAGITKSITYWSPDELYSYNGTMWELQPVEIAPRAIPQSPVAILKPEEQSIFDGLNINPQEIKDFLAERELALIVGRDITTRDKFDFQQPFNLAVPGGYADTRGDNGRVYFVRHLQIFQGNQIRGYGSSSNSGRRVLAIPMEGLESVNLPNSAGPLGSVPIYADGSYAAIVPAKRALSWQLTDVAHSPVVRERYWLTFKPGEIRVCTSCHGITSTNQAGGGEPTNSPIALGELLRFIRSLPPENFPPVVTDPPTQTPTSYSIQSSSIKLYRKRQLITKVKITSNPSQPGKLFNFTSCLSSGKNIRLGADGSVVLQLKFPVVRRTQSVALQLKNGSNVVKRKTLRLKPLRGQRGGTLTAKALCRSSSIIVLSR